MIRVIRYKTQQTINTNKYKKMRDICCLVDIGGIVDHHCLNFIFIIQLLPDTTRKDISQKII
jgi:hypothetical protein